MRRTCSSASGSADRFHSGRQGAEGHAAQMKRAMESMVQAIKAARIAVE